ncbi:hypothetical protein BDW71DRAFT_25994 [Aspergillus fruticulosus]
MSLYSPRSPSSSNSAAASATTPSLKAAPPRNSEPHGCAGTAHHLTRPHPVRGSGGDGAQLLRSSTSQERQVQLPSNIMHDYPDERCVARLKNIIPAMGPDLSILINDMVLPDAGCI